MHEKRMTIAEWLDHIYAPDSKPTERTVRNWIKSGALRAERHGRSYYLLPTTLPRQKYRL